MLSTIPKEYQYIIKSKNRLNSSISLANILEITEDELIQSSVQLHKYKEKYIPKKNGTRRHIYKPSPNIRKIQSLINSRVIKPNILWPSYIFGCIPNSLNEQNKLIRKDYIACAKVHCRSKSVAHLDIENFFDNISDFHINNIFCDFFKMNARVAKILTDLVCYKGTLVQGALTSSYLASLLFFKIEPLIFLRFKSKGIRYTRLIDDITLSTNRLDYKFNSEIETIKKMLNDYDLSINHEKLQIENFSSKPITVHNLRIDHNEPRYSKLEIRRIRNLVKNITNQSILSNYRTSIFYRKDYFRCMGTINKLSLTNHYYHKRFLKKINSIKPLPSKIDIYNLSILVKKLEITPKNQRNSYHFIKRKNIALNKAYLIKKIYKHEAKKILDKINEL